MSETSSNALFIVGSLVLACLLIAFAFFAWNTAKETGNEAVRQTNEMNVSLQESEFTQYDAAEVTGNEIINIVKKFQNEDVYVCVTNGNGSFYFNRDASLSKDGATPLNNAKKKTEGCYINPGSRFLGEVVRDENTEAIIGLNFEIVLTK